MLASFTFQLNLRHETNTFVKCAFPKDVLMSLFLGAVQNIGSHPLSPRVLRALCIVLLYITACVS